MMNLTRLTGPQPATGKKNIPDIFSGRVNDRILLSLIALALVVSGAFAFDNRILELYAAIIRAFAGTWQRIQSLSPWHKFLLFAPALLLDTPRYYITNCYVILLKLFRDPDYRTAPQLYDDPRMAPLVSVIIPVCNQGHLLIHTLDTVLENSYPNFEVIVVDDGSSDHTPEICEDYQRRGKIRFARQLVNSGKPSAINAGHALARGEIIVHVDGDTVLWRDAIAEIVKPMRDRRVGAVSGNLRIMNDFASFWTGFQAVEYALTIDVHRRFLAHANILEIVSGAFGAYRRELIQHLKGADPETGEDLDLTLKARKLGWRIGFAPRAIALTEAPVTMLRLWKQRIFWERCYIRINLRKHGNLFRWKIFRMVNAFMMTLDFLFNVVLLLLFPVYLLIIYLFFRHLFLFVLLATFIFYQIVTIIQVAVAWMFSPNRPRDSQMFVYAPIYFLYSNFLRLVRTTAYFLELIRSDLYKKGQMPAKVWDAMPEYSFVSPWK